MSFDPTRLQISGYVRALPGYEACGDAFCGFTTERYWCAALVDGVGHGIEAAAASSAAVSLLRRSSWDQLTTLVQKADRELRSTRGVVMTLIRVDRHLGVLTHAGVGNVEMRGSSQEAIRPVTTPGIVGAGVRRVMERSYQLSWGDVLVAFTDGVSSRFPSTALYAQQGDSLARHLVAQWGKDHDDAGCMVIRC